jgi:hypothetical protein
MVADKPKKKLPGPKLDNDKIARIVLDAKLLGDESAAKRHDVSTKTVGRYKQLVEADSKLSDLVCEKLKLVEGDWGIGLASAIRGQIEFLNRAATCADASDPHAVHAIAGALKILADVALTSRMLDARLTPGAREEAAPTRSLAVEMPTTPTAH